MHKIDFATRLIKGRIAETIFELMFRETKKFEVIPLGYEYVAPQLLSYQDTSDIVHKVTDTIRSLPDFAIITPNKKEVYFVEVKYRKEKDNEEIKQLAIQLEEKWNPIWLFIATPEAFYFDSCNDIIYHHPQIQPLEWNWVGAEIQDKYIPLIQEFER